MNEKALHLSERFVSLSLAQALLRKQYRVEDGQRLTGGYEVDLAAYMPPGRLRLVVEIKIISNSGNIPAAIASARKQIARARAPGVAAYAAVAFPGSETIYVDEGLLDVLSGAYEDLDLRSIADLQ